VRLEEEAISTDSDGGLSDGLDERRLATGDAAGLVGALE